MANIADIYSKYAETEWNRLTLDAYHYLEFQVTMHYLQRYLPPTGLILDAGGGPGRYALELCRQGREVVLCDLAPGNISLAREQFAASPESVQCNLRDALVADIRTLPFPEGHFSAVLCVGAPLSHLPDASDRHQAVRELIRVTVPGGLVALTGIGHLALLRYIMMTHSHQFTDGSLATLFTDGSFPGPAGMVWHSFRAQELQNLAEQNGLTTLTMAGCQSLSTHLEDATNRLHEDKEKWPVWMEILLSTASEPAVVDMSDHILYIGSKCSSQNTELEDIRKW